MSKIRVAHFVHSFLPVTQNWVYNQIVFNESCDALVLCQTLENQSQFPLQNVCAAYPRAGVAARFNLLLSRARAQYRRSPYRSSLAAFKPSLLHGHMATESWQNFGLARETGLPLVTTFYGLDVNKLWQRHPWKRRYAELFRTGAAFMVEGEHMATCLESIGCPRDKITVVRLGVDIERIRAHAMAKDPARTRVLFVGLSREKKGAEYAARAFARAAREEPSLEFHAVGDGKYRAVAERIIAEAGLTERATFHGYLSVDGYLKLLGTTDICMAPSVTAADGDTEGGAPVTVIEAQVAGVPVVGTNHCDIPNVVRDNETGLLCDERDIEGLIHRLGLLAMNRRLREEMARAAEKRARENHDIREQVKRVTDVYRSVLERTGARAA